MPNKYKAALRELSELGAKKRTDSNGTTYLVYEGTSYELLSDYRVSIEGKPKSARLLLPKYAHLNAPSERPKILQRMANTSRNGKIAEYIDDVTDGGQWLVNQVIKVITNSRTKAPDRLKAIEMLMNRGYGMPTQTVDNQGNSGTGYVPANEAIRSVLNDPDATKSLEILAIRVMEGNASHNGHAPEQDSSRIIDVAPSAPPTDII